MIVTNLYKKDNSQNASNYLQVSVFSIFSKLYEKCMYSHLYSFLLKFKLLFKRQFGFKNNHLTNHALTNLVDLILKYLDNDCHVFWAFLDLQKTLGTINYDIILEKLEYYSIRGFATKVTNNMFFYMEFLLTSKHWHGCFLKDFIQVLYYFFYILMTYSVCSPNQSSTILTTILIFYFLVKN